MVIKTSRIVSLYIIVFLSSIIAITPARSAPAAGFVLRVRGEVLVWRRGWRKSQKADRGFPLCYGDTVRVTQSAQVCIYYPAEEHQFTWGSGIHIFDFKRNPSRLDDPLTRVWKRTHKAVATHKDEEGIVVDDARGNSPLDWLIDIQLARPEYWPAWIAPKSVIARTEHDTFLINLAAQDIPVEDKHILLAEIEAAYGRKDLAISELNQISSGRSDPVVQIDLGDLFLFQENSVEAEARYKNAADLAKRQEKSLLAAIAKQSLAILFGSQHKEENAKIAADEAYQLYKEMGEETAATSVKNLDF